MKLEERFGLQGRHALVIGVAALGSESFTHLCGPDRPIPDAGIVTILGPGTGLGVAALLRRPGSYGVLETEGGHVAFSPEGDEETAVLARLAARFGRVSNERLISGGGLVNIHRALCELDGKPVPGDFKPRDVTAGADTGDARCVRALDMFCAAFGAATGDLVLTLGAWDGAFLTGGLVPRLLPRLQSSQFRARFESKGRFREAMSHVPTMAVVHPHAGLLGAAAFAAQDAGLPL